MQGSIAPVLHCLSTLRASFDLSVGDEYTQNYSRKKWNLYEVDSLDGIHNLSGQRFQDFQNGSVVSGMIHVQKENLNCANISFRFHCEVYLWLTLLLISKGQCS